MVLLPWVYNGFAKEMVTMVNLSETMIAPISKMVNPGKARETVCKTMVHRVEPWSIPVKQW